MAKVFRLTTGANVNHWGDTSEYNNSIIDGISTKDGDKTRKEPTSIPSPFARLDVFNKAFKVLVDNRSLDGTTVNHKMVSDVLDMLEISFNADAFSELSISFWDKKSQLDSLLNSNNKKHKLYGETLKLFLAQDQKSFNFSDINGFYIFKYKHKVIGGTSPLTLFFTSANDLSFAQVKLNNGNTLFDGHYCPLYKRDVDFIKYVASLFISSDVLKSKMLNFYDYFVLTLNKLNNTNYTLFSEINEYSSSNNYLTKCKTLDTGIKGQNVEIFGLPLYKRNSDLPIDKESEFVISSERYLELFPGSKMPVALQNKYNKSLRYTSSNAKWDINTQVPYVDSNEIHNRTLPGSVVKYPYLTVSDFLEPVLFQLNHTLNTSAFYDGNLKESVSKNFALPLTKTFFDFFTVDDLINKKVGRESMLEMIVLPNSVDVSLRIPINNDSDYITFQRTYENASSINQQKPDLDKNKGVIEVLEGSLAVFPFIQSEYVKEYRVGLYNSGSSMISLNYFNLKNENNRIIAKTKRTEDDFLKSSYQLVGERFEYISINQSGYSNVFLPKWKIQKSKNEEFTFAIDFGTTNTHVEYQIGNSSPKPFEILEKEILYQSTLSEENFKSGRLGDIFDMKRLTEIEFMPSIIDVKGKYSFPLRTSICSRADLNLDSPSFTLMDYSIPFLYQKIALVEDNFSLKTNLKWESSTKNYTEKFLEELILLIKYKVIFNNGNLSKTKIKWSFPLSMTRMMLNKLEKTFEKIIELHLGSSVEVSKYSESLAPFQYLIKSEGISSLNRPVASIDIGGGTVDMVVYYKDQPQLITSFKLGVNALFGNGYNKSKNVNGFKDIYQIIQKNLGQNKPDLYRIGENLLDKNDDFIEYSIFAFSLENNQDLKLGNHEILFRDLIKDKKENQIVFLFYYASIIYHLARVMQSKNLDFPTSITFSGNGSKILQVIDETKKASILNELTNLIFSKVYKSDIEKIKIAKFDNPKEMTAKGMIYSEEDVNIKSISYTLIGDEHNTSSVNYIDIDNYLDSVVIEFENFVDMFFALNKEFSFSDNFEIETKELKKYHSFIKDQIKEELLLGLNDRKKQLGEDLDIPINESLFFYPVYGILNSLSTFIYQNDED